MINDNEYKCYYCKEICKKGDPAIVRAVGKLYHKQCFQCNICHISVLSKFYVLNHSSFTILCEKDYYNQVQFKCQQCTKLITNDQYELIGDYKYHKHCLHCPECDNNQQEDLERFEYDGKPYCRFHYSLQKGTGCIGCGQAILYQYKYKNGKKWHPECYMLKKYWDIELSLCYPVSMDIEKKELLRIQDELLKKRERLWKITSQFQATMTSLLSNIVQECQFSNFKREYELCHYLTHYVFTLFHIIDDQSTYLSCEDPIKNTTDNMMLFLDTLCRMDTLNEMEILLKITDRLSSHTRDLLKLSLQQAIILENEQNSVLSVMDRMIHPENDEIEYKSAGIQECVQWIQMSLIRLGFVLDSRQKSSTLFLGFPNMTDHKKAEFITQEEKTNMDRIKRALTQRKQSTSIQHDMPLFLPELSQQQDNTIRHISLLYLNNIDASIMEELLNYKRDSFWGKLKTHINSPNSLDAKKVIGVSLSNLSNSSLSQHSTSMSASFEKWVSECPSIQTCFSSTSLVPNFLKDCILVMIDGDINTEGLFRKNGNIRGIKDICETIDASPDREDWFNYFKGHSMVQLAAFVKKFLRELPEPLLTRRLYKLFLLSNRAAHPKDAVHMIHYTMCLLPKQNRDILLVLLALLHWVAKHAAQNKMDYENLARVIAPTILYHRETEGNCREEINVITLMIEHYERLIAVPAKLMDLLKYSKLSDYVQTKAIDLTSTKQFIQNYRQLLKIKKDFSNNVLLSPTSTKYQPTILSSS